MKKYHILFLVTTLTLFSLLISGCAINSPREAQEIDYLDQIQPREKPLIFAPGIVSVKGRFEMGFTMSADRSVMAFGVLHESDPAQTNIQFLTWKNGRWTGPDKNLLPDNINASLPMFGPADREFYFSKAAAGAENDIWVGDYTPDAITHIRKLNAAVNSDQREAGHGISANGTLYFTSNRDEKEACCGDIYRALAADNYASAEKVTSLSSPSDEDGLYLSPDEDYMIIQAWKNEYQTKHDLYISYRTYSGGWTSPQRLSDQINGPDIEQSPFVSPDKKYLFFSRMSEEQNGSSTQYESDIYWVRTDKVFKPYPYNPVNTFKVDGQGKFRITLPHDLFRDVNSKTLVYQVLMPDGSPTPDDMFFDNKRLFLTGSMNSASSMTLEVKTKDSDGNEAAVYIELIAENTENN
jgi:hypothetical protein